jgi:hypothetical protein
VLGFVFDATDVEVGLAVTVWERGLPELFEEE